jgi:hypothetical protein
MVGICFDGAAFSRSHGRKVLLQKDHSWPYDAIPMPNISNKSEGWENRNKA